MPDHQRHLFAIGAILLTLGAVVAGTQVRTHLQLGDEVTRSRPMAANAPLAIEGQIVAGTQPGGGLSEGEYFFQLVELLRQQYVDPVTDEQKLAIGAVRGMIAGLADPNAEFFEPEEFAVYQGMRRGVFQGIGVEMDIRFDLDALQRLRAGDTTLDARSLVPDVRLGAVLPGSPAEAAGLAPNDQVLSVNGRAVLNPQEFEEIRLAQRAVAEGTRTPEQLEELQQRLRLRSEHVISPARARELLTMGTDGVVAVEVRRGNETLTVQVTATDTKVPPVIAEGDTIQLRLFEGASAALQSADLPSGPLTLDLRNSTRGDVSVVPEVLGQLVPAGRYGSLVALHSTRPLESRGGPSTPRVNRVLVDETTRGAAAILALALESTGEVTLEGTLPVREVPWTEVSELPDGGGYILPTATYVPGTAEVRS